MPIEGHTAFVCRDLRSWLLKGIPLGEAPGYTGLGSPRRSPSASSRIAWHAAFDLYDCSSALFLSVVASATVSVPCR